MPTMVEDPTESLPATSAAQRLRTTMAAVRVTFLWLGVRKSLTPDQKSQAADTFGAESEFFSAGKKLLERLSLKVGYYLTDVSQPDLGNTLIVPGSHLWDEIDCPDDGQTNPVGAEPLVLAARHAVLVDRRIWHSRSANLSDQTRKVQW